MIEASQNQNNFSGGDEEIDFRRILLIALDKWYLFVVFLVLSMVLSYTYIWYTQPVFKMSATVLVEDEGSDVSQNILDEVGIIGKKRNIENEIAILSSRSLMRKAISKLDLNISYKADLGLRTRTLYTNTPITMEYLPAADPVNFVCYVSVDTDNEEVNLNFEIPLSNGDIRDFTQVIRFSEPFTNELGSFSLQKTSFFNSLVAGESPLTKEYVLSYSTDDQLTSRYLNVLNVSEAREKASILKIQLEDVVPERGVDIVDALLDVFVQSNIEKKNQLASNSLKFIDGQLEHITTDLNTLEADIKSFKTRYGVSDISLEAEFFLEQVGSLDKSVSEIDVKLSVINYLEEYINSDKNLSNASPSSLGIADPLLQQLIVKLSELSSERESMLRFTKEDNPLIDAIDSKINEAKASLIKNMASIRNGLEASKKELQQQMVSIEGEVSSLPKAEYELLALQRQYSIKESLYLLLLEKKSENAIILASTISDNTVIDEARSSDKPISPRKNLAYLLGVIVGLGLPSVYVLLASLLDNRIKDADELKKFTSIPFLGIIPHHNNQEYVVVGRSVNSAIAEAFRSIRTNLNFLVGSDNQSKVIQLTSAMGSEGKSFSSINLAVSMGLAGSKTIVVGLDLRKPKLAEYFDHSNDVGASSVLAGISSLDDAISSSGHENVDVLVGGPVPPNPSELLLGQSMTDMLKELEARYENVILDTPPIGLVTDSLIISEHAATTIYVVRQNVTNVHSLRYIDDLYSSGKIESVSILLNDVKSGQFGYGYGYGSGYGYGYGYGSYGNDDSHENFLERLLRKLR